MKNKAERAKQGYINSLTRKKLVISILEFSDRIQT